MSSSLYLYGIAALAVDFIREPKKDDEDEQMSYEERHLNYERYRILVQNEFLTISESKFLHQLYLEEKFGKSDNEKYNNILD